MVLSTSQQVAMAFTAVLFTFVVLPRLFGVGGGTGAKETRFDSRHTRKAAGLGPGAVRGQPVNVNGPGSPQSPENMQHMKKLMEQELKGDKYKSSSNKGYVFTLMPLYAIGVGVFAAYKFLKIKSADEQAQKDKFTKGTKKSTEAENQLNELEQRLAQTEKMLNSILTQLDPLTNCVKSVAQDQKNEIMSQLQTIRYLMKKRGMDCSPLNISDSSCERNLDDLIESLGANGDSTADASPVAKQPSAGTLAASEEVYHEPLEAKDEAAAEGEDMRELILEKSDRETEEEEEEEEEEEGFTETMREQSLDEMEESGRSATPVNSEQPEELTEQEQQPEADLTSKAEEHLTPPITEEMKSVSTFQILELQKVIDDLSGRLEKRESQLLVVSKDKARLEEECDNLKDEVISLKEESSTVQSLKDEFTQRIADTERKAQLACKERDIAKKEIKGLREELSTRLNSSDTMEIIREKEEQIRGLLEEGEKLSKQQLQHSNIIKKLRVKEKESDTKINKQQKKVKEQEEVLRHLQQVLDGKEEVEKQHRENIKKLNGVVERQEKELSRLQTDSEELQEKNRSLQAALDNSYKELAELHKINASRASEVEEAALSRETQAKEQLSLALEKAQEEGRVQQEALANQVADLRLALQRAEQQQGRKEDYLREEISELQQRLQEAETRNQELSQGVTSATRPLLRQIENLQASLGAQTASWEKLEKNISDRLADAQAQLAVAVEKERSAAEELLSIKSQLASFESQNSLLRQEKARILAQMEAEKNKREKLEDESSREHVELENLRGEHSRMVEEAKKEKLLLANQLEMEKMKVEQEKKKYYLAQEALKEKERKAMTHSVGEPPASSTPSLSRSSSISGVDNAGLHSSILSQDDSLDPSLGTMTMSMSMSGTNLYEAARLSGGSSIIENLQSQLKLREGEIAQLQLEISSLERSRSVMAEELVRLTNQNDEMEEKVKEIPKFKIQLKDLEQRHNTILQMYGEKAEEAEELRLDLEDVKNMYKTQIDELLKNQK